MIIKFSHRYPKLLGEDGNSIQQAILLDILPVNLESLSQPFLDYDSDNGLFEFPKEGKYLLLIFKKVSSNKSENLFTTLRNCPKEREEYYRSGIGKIFEIGFKSGI